MNLRKTQIKLTALILLTSLVGCSDNERHTLTDIAAAKINAASLAAMALGGNMTHPAKWKEFNVPKSFVDGYDAEKCIYWEAVQGTSSAEIDNINYSYGCLAKIGIENNLLALQNVTKE